MSDKPHQVDSKNPIVNKMLLDLAEANGWMVESSMKSAFWQWLTLDDLWVHGNSAERKDRNTITIDQAVDLLSAPKEEPIVIGGCTVEVRSDGGVECGCIDLTFDQVEQICRGEIKPDSFQVETSNTSVSRCLQELAFKAGYMWQTGVAKVLHTNSKFLVFHQKKSMTHGMSIEIKAVPLARAIELLSKPQSKLELSNGAYASFAKDGGINVVPKKGAGWIVTKKQKEEIHKRAMAAREKGGSQ